MMLLWAGAGAAEVADGGYKFKFDGRKIEPRILTVNGPVPAMGDVAWVQDFVFCLDEPGEYDLSESIDCLVRKMPDGGERRIACKISAPAEVGADPSARLFRRKKPGTDVFLGFTPEERTHLRGIRVADWSPTLEQWLAGFDLTRVCVLLERPALGGEDKPELPSLPTTLKNLILDTGSGWKCTDLTPLTRFKQLRLLDLTEAFPHEVDMAVLAKLPLEYLSLTSSTTWKNFEALGTIVSLKTLVANHCTGMGDGRVLAGLTGLRELYARHLWNRPDRPVVPLDLRSLSAFKELVVLEVANSQVGALPEQTLPALRSADVLLCGAPREEVEAFVKANPQAEIRHGLNDELQKVLARAERLRVRTGGVCHRDEDAEKTIVEIKDPKMIVEIGKRFEVNEEDSGGHCMCCGDPTFEFYADGKIIATLGFHHGRSVRWSDGIWPGDGTLTSGSATFLIQWLAENGCDGPLQEHLGRKREQAAEERRWQRYDAILPREAMTAVRAAKDWEGIAKTLTASLPAGPEGATLLLRLYGCDFQSWELASAMDRILSETLLPETPPEVLAKAIRQCQPDTEEALGAARWLFGEGKADSWEDRVEELEPLARFALTHPRQANRWRCMAVLCGIGKPFVPLLREVMRSGTKPKELPREERDEAGGMLTYRPDTLDLPEGATDQQAAALCLNMLGDVESQKEVAAIRGQLTTEWMTKWDETVRRFQEKR